jgi:hypothetical protein
MSLAPPVLAQDASLSFGGDQYTAGQHATIAAPVANDAFLAGYNVTFTAPVAGDAHVAGFDVKATSDIAGNFYAMGYAVAVLGSVGGDLTAAANTVTVGTTSPISGNVRLAGATVTVSSPVTGSALISAQTLTLDAPITGDLNFIGENLVFAPGALVTGKVLIQAPKEIAVPVTVASPDRVTYQVLSSPDYMSEAGKTAENVVRGFWPAFWAAAVWWLALLLIGAVFIAFMPRGVAAIETVASGRLWRNLGIGILAFAAALGLVPVVALTVVGIVLLPIVLVFVVAACSLALLAGAYALGMMLVRRFVAVETNLRRVMVLAATLVVTALIGMIPILGWIVTLTVLIFGFGVLATWIVAGRSGAGRPHIPDAVLPPTPSPQPAAQG